MRKLLRHRKALSPVVAAIILIAVTVAVSIAVAAWMGALTIGFMGSTEELNIVDVHYTTNATEVTIEVANVGTGKVTIKDIRIDGTTYATFGDGSGDVDPALSYDLDKGSSETFTLSFATSPFNSGVIYTFTVHTAKNQFPYPKICPS